MIDMRFGQGKYFPDILRFGDGRFDISEREQFLSDNLSQALGDLPLPLGKDAMSIMYWLGAALALFLLGYLLYALLKAEQF